MLPSGWKAKESKSHPGTFFYINDFSGETQWEMPTKPAEPKATESVRASHILRKHRGSRRPASWRCENITQSKEESVRQINEYRNQLIEILEREGPQAMQKMFSDLAKTESDCSSAQKGGDLGSFTRGQMQKPFEDATFVLSVGGLSDIVDTDSGIHIILRLA